MITKADLHSLGHEQRVDNLVSMNSLPLISDFVWK